MSREIKFRVWSEEDKGYRTDCNLTELFTSETGTPATVYSDEGDRFDIEQYTGLKDKNGKEIYEGDIIKFIDLELAMKPTGVVCFADGKFFVKDWDFGDGSYHIVDFYDYNVPHRDFEVVGNIHENPELLGGEE